MDSRSVLRAYTENNKQTQVVRMGANSGRGREHVLEEKVDKYKYCLMGEGGGWDGDNYVSPTCLKARV